MNYEPIEERLSREWNLHKARNILDKIIGKNESAVSLAQILTGEKLVVCSYALGKILASPDIRLKSAQLRRFYESMINIKARTIAVKLKENSQELFERNIKPEIFLLKPQLANARARQNKEVTPFFEVINPLFDFIYTIEDYEMLCKFVESVVAYHKFHGGRD